jgi:hypothetical protein
MRPLALALLLAATGLAGCGGAPAPPVETRRLVAAPPAVAAERVQAALDGLGFAPAGPDGRRERASAPDDWAYCPIVITRGGSGGDDGSGQRDFARPQTRRAEVRVDVLPAGEGSMVSVAADFAATYHHRYRNLPFTEGCQSLGVLEGRLLDAAA